MKESFEELLEKELQSKNNGWNDDTYRNKRLNSANIREIFAVSHEVNLKRDENGKPIVGSGRLITNEEKKMVFDYIMDNDYPLTRGVYNIVLNAYVNGDLDLIQKHSPKL